MNILYDYQCFISEVNGASRSFCEIINKLSKTESIEVFAPFNRNLYLNKISGNFTPFISFNNKVIRHSEIFLNRLLSIHRVKKMDYDIFHPTSDSSIYYKDICKKPFVVTIHDMIPENVYKNSRRLPNRKWIVENAARIVCVSNNTKKELLEYYSQLDENAIDVIYHGINLEEFIDYKNNIWGRYILYVGERFERKNFLFFVTSIIPLLKKDKTIKVLCTGRYFSKSEMQFFVENNISGQLVDLGYVEDSILYSLYKHALLFVFPSLYEGFGIPILEAFANDCPVCLADATCFPEIGGEAALYFNPKDRDSILYTITKVIEDESLADVLRRKGKERAKMFTWQKSAEAMRECYLKALN